MSSSAVRLVRRARTHTHRDPAFRDRCRPPDTRVVALHKWSRDRLAPWARLDDMGTVRAAAPPDAAAIETVWAAVAAEGEWIGTELPLHPRWRARFLAALDADESAWFIADEGGRVVGGVFVQAERGVAHVGMAVVEEHRGVGLGRTLLDAAIGWARDRDCHKVTLEVWPHNVRARDLYTRAGFADEGYLKRHYRRKSGALWDAIVMSLILDEDSPGRR